MHSGESSGPNDTLIPMAIDLVHEVADWLPECRWVFAVRISLPCSGATCNRNPNGNLSCLARETKGDIPLHPSTESLLSFFKYDTSSMLDFKKS